MLWLLLKIAHRFLALFDAAVDEMGAGRNHLQPEEFLICLPRFVVDSELASLGKSRRIWTSSCCSPLSKMPLSQIGRALFIPQFTCFFSPSIFPRCWRQKGEKERLKSDRLIIFSLNFEPALVPKISKNHNRIRTRGFSFASPKPGRERSTVFHKEVDSWKVEKNVK